MQIEFTAWNYSAGNLWAALVLHILENLRLSRDEENELVEARRKHLQDKMELERAEEVAEQARRVSSKAGEARNALTNRVGIMKIARRSSGVG